MRNFFNFCFFVKHIRLSNQPLFLFYWSLQFISFTMTIAMYYNNSLRPIPNVDAVALAKDCLTHCWIWVGENACKPETCSRTQNTTCTVVLLLASQSCMIVRSSMQDKSYMSWISSINQILFYNSLFLLAARSVSELSVYCKSWSLLSRHLSLAGFFCLPFFWLTLL